MLLLIAIAPKFSASEAVEAMNYMAMAGWKTEDMLSDIEGVIIDSSTPGGKSKRLYALLVSKRKVSKPPGW